MRVWFLLMSVVTVTGLSGGHIQMFSEYRKCETKLCYNVISSPLTDEDIYQTTDVMARPMPNVLHKMVNFESLSEKEWDLERGQPAVTVWQEAEDFLRFTRTAMWVHSQYSNEHYILSNGSIKPDTLRELMKNTLLRLDTKAFFLSKEQTSSNITMLEVYRKNSKMSSTAELIAQRACSKSKSLCDPLSNIWNRRSNLTGIKLNAAYADMDNNIVRHNDTKKVAGFFPDLFHDIQKLLNFTYEFKFVKNGLHTRRKPDGNWTGLMGLLQNRKADITMSGQTYAVPKLRYIDFATMIMEDKMRIYFGLKNSYDLNMWEILRIFRRDAFMTFIAISWVLAACLAMIYHLDTHVSVSRGLVFAVASVGNILILKHFDAAVSPSRAKKILFLSMGILATLMFDYIRAGLLVNLAARKQIYFLKNLEDMSSKHIKLMFRAKSGLHILLKTSNPGSLEHKLWNENVLPHGEDKLGVKSHEEGLNFVANNPGYAYLFFENFVNRQGLHPCSIIDLPGVSLSRVHVSFALQKDSPLTEMFDFFLKRLIISGVVRKTRKKYYDTTPTTCANDSDGALNFKALFSIFFFFLIGVALAFLAIIFEGLMGPLHKGHKKKLPHPMDPEDESGETLPNEEKIEPIDIYVLLEIISQQRLKIEEYRRLFKIYRIKKEEKAETAL